MNTVPRLRSNKDQVYEDIEASGLEDVGLPANIVNKYEKLNRGKSEDRHLRKKENPYGKPKRKFERNKKAGRKKWATPTKSH